MKNISITALLAWIKLGQQVWEVGAPAFESIRKALAAHGIDQDNALLDVVIAEAPNRKAQAQADAAGGE